MGMSRRYVDGALDIILHLPSVSKRNDLDSHGQPSFEKAKKAESSCGDPTFEISSTGLDDHLHHFGIPIQREADSLVSANEIVIAEESFEGNPAAFIRAACRMGRPVSFDQFF